MAQIARSLLVPCVQELVKNPALVVPDRYIRPDQDSPLISDDTLISQIPVIDMQSLLSKESMDSELAKLDFACKEWGFFQLVNHGMSTAFLEKLKKEVEGFFNLSMEEKKKYWQHPGDIEGFGQAFVVSEEQKLDWADLFNMMTLPVHLRKPHLFPELPSSLRETLEVYSMELKTLSENLISKMGEVLNIKDEEMREFFENGVQAMRMNYYPPCPQPEKVMGLSPHSDAAALAILRQLNEVEGLQIKKDGKWIPVTPLPDAFIVNIGDTLEAIIIINYLNLAFLCACLCALIIFAWQIITNGTYPSIEHRAVVNSVQERLSVATAYSLRYDGEVYPAPSLISEKTPPLFRRVRIEEYFRSRYARELRGKSQLDSLRIQHSQG
ncbi:protein SRG1 [Citrus sinensis]|uniref:Protein SRG1 n=1 Tax=Citrus sinensis TaxID=2711 RepID=A0ACB8M1Q6_CITSI|nr:protein SRG1 [Citrus sinensis]